MAVFSVNPDVNSSPLVPGDDKAVGQLRSVSNEYAYNIAEWNFLMAAYEGVRSLIQLGVLKQHERESDNNYTRRLTEMFGFDYTRSIVDLFTFYLFKKPGAAKLPDRLAMSPEWNAFINDCNLRGDTLEEYLPDQTRYSSIYGHVGFLVDKPRSDSRTVSDDRKKGIYPYISGYHPTAILDWEWERDETQRTFLAFLKLKDDDGTYRLWWPDHWEVWEEPEGPDEVALDDVKAVRVASGENPLGEIPFVWLYNLRSRVQSIGISDVHEVARIDTSIIRDMSQITEITNYAAFPMMRKPMIRDGEDVQDDAGPSSILEFDPDLGMTGKPDWLKAEVSGPVKSILDVIAKKIAEIYRATNAGGLTATETSKAAKSGMALQAEFQFLNANIVRKAVNLEKAENNIMYFWLRWMKWDDLIKDTQFERPRNYDVQNLSLELENTITAKSIVPSLTFRKALSGSTVRSMLPGAPPEMLLTIDAEIDEGEEFHVPGVKPTEVAEEREELEDQEGDQEAEEE
jgi:hypothetical protein